MARSVYVKIKAEELAALQNEISNLRTRLAQYEDTERQVHLLDTMGRPVDKTTYPLYKPGPNSVLEKFPNTFTLEYAMSHGATKASMAMWKYRGYVYMDKKEKYHKSDKYKLRMKQTKYTEVDWNKINCN